MIDYIVFFTSILAIFRPEIIGILELTSVDNAFSIILIIDLLILLYRVKGKIRRVTGKYITWTMSFWGICLIPTIIYFQNIRGIVVLLIKSLILGLLCYYCGSNYKRYVRLIHVSAFIYAGLMMMNLIFIYILPYGSFTTPAYNSVGELVYNYLLGPKNNFSTFALTGALLVALVEIHHRKQTGKYLFAYIILCIYSMYIVKCSTGLLLFVIIAGVLLFRFQRLLRQKSVRNMAIIICAFVIIVIFSISVVMSEDFLQQITHSRWLIWFQAFNLIIRKPFLGYGMQLEHDLIYLYGSYRYSHNEILEITLYGGIVALFMYFHIIRNIFKDIKVLNKDYRNIFYIYMIGYFAAQMLEAKFTSLFIFYVVFLFNTIVINKSFQRTTNA